MKPPLIFDLRTTTIEEIKKSQEVKQIIDTYEEQLKDLFFIRNPRFRFDKEYAAHLKDFIKDFSRGEALEKSGKWVHFPWNGSLVHYLDDEVHQEIRTARNKNLILPEEQKKFYNFSVGVAGLSVGSHGALTIALMGGSRKIKLADPDVISPSNLNRMRFDFTTIGANKAELIAQYIYQLNPYAEVSVYTEGITPDNVEEFLDGLDVLVEELDDIEVKVKMREMARKRKMPVVMATDNGDGVIIDIERFDLNPELPVFHGKLDGFDIAEVKKSPQKMYEAMARIIDISLVPTRVLHSVMEVGKTIYSWPQLASAATFSGAVLAYVVRKIALGDDLVQGKVDLNLDTFFDPLYAQHKDIRAAEAEKFLKGVGMS